MSTELDLKSLQINLRHTHESIGLSKSLAMKLIQESEETRAKHRKAWGRAEKAEQAVARVREVLEHHTFVADDKYGDLAASQYYGNSELNAVSAESITRALDGDGRG